jgi:hypothetical protein
MIADRQPALVPARHALTVSVVVASYRRLNRLEECIDGLQAQTEPPSEVWIVTHSSDTETAAWVERRRREWGAIRLAIVSATNVCVSYNRGLIRSSGEIVAYIDDDAVPRPDWLARIVETYAADLMIAAVGGRDAIHGEIFQRDPGPVSRLLRTQDVGRVTWVGRITGNHHIGTGPARDTDVLKGVNMSFRRSALEYGFDERLLGVGALPHCEVSVTLPLRRRGLRVVYDPGIVVDHFPASRTRGFARSDHDAQATLVLAHNEALVMLDYLPPGRRVLSGVWALAVGTGLTPGVVLLVRDLVERRRGAWTRFRSAQRGRRQALSTRRVPRARLPPGVTASSPARPVQAVPFTD